MANVIHRTQRDAAGCLIYRTSVNTPDYSTDDWVINPDLSGVEGVDCKYWKVTGSPPDGVVEEMTQGEKDAVDAAELAAAKTQRKIDLRQEGVDYFETRYSLFVQDMFASLHFDAFETGKTNRRAYLATYWNWRAQGAAHINGKIESVDSQTTIEDVNNVAINYTLLNTNDPLCTLPAALAITD
jgi:hypothetical protein